jgi:hypothetical protein
VILRLHLDQRAPHALHVTFAPVTPLYKLRNPWELGYLMLLVSK